MYSTSILGSNGKFERDDRFLFITVFTLHHSEMDGHDTDSTKQSTADMTAFVQNLLQQMQDRFQTLSQSIISKIDEMGNRIDELEQSINDLKTEMGQEGVPSPSSVLTSKDETRSADDS